MSETRRIFDRLTEGTDLAAAALLFATYETRAPVIVARDELPMIRELERLGCIHEGRITPQGCKVAIFLEAVEGLQRNVTRDAVNT